MGWHTPCPLPPAIFFFSWNMSASDDGLKKLSRLSMPHGWRFWVHDDFYRLNQKQNRLGGSVIIGVNVSS